jgi:hypothetical protein
MRQVVMVAAFIGLLLPSAAAAPGAAQTEQARVDGSIVWGSLDSVILEYGVDRSGGYIQEKLIKKGLAGAVAGEQQEAVLVFTNTATSEAQELKVAMGGREDRLRDTTHSWALQASRAWARVGDRRRSVHGRSTRGW